MAHHCVPQRPRSQVTVTMSAMTSLFMPLSRENYLPKVAGVGHRPLGTCCWQNSQNLLGPAGVCPLCYAPDSRDNPEKPSGCSGMGPVYRQPRTKDTFLLSSWAQTMHLPVEAEALNPQQFASLSFRILGRICVLLGGKQCLSRLSSAVFMITLQNRQWAFSSPMERHPLLVLSSAGD